MVKNMMDRLAKETAKRIAEVHEKANRLEVGEEVFQCYLACLPPLHELRDSINANADGKVFEVWPVINGTLIKRKS